ncbi:13950_t:CDS:2 [Entrophospora sp. SA101]|nr:13950_t:CDS:2 [Entrophospora sp. SA101]
MSQFAIQNNLKILPFNVWLEKGNSKCCLNKLMVILYQKRNWEIGRMRICCLKKIQSETLRVTKQLIKPKRSEKEVYHSSYKAVRGSIAHIIFQAFLGVNERKYIRESENVKEENAAIVEFQKDPSAEKVKQLIRLYSPLYREDSEIVNQMRNFRQLYRYYQAACKINPAEKKQLKILSVFSPITGELRELTIAEAWIEYSFPKQVVGGSNPSRSAKYKKIIIFIDTTSTLSESNNCYKFGLVSTLRGYEKKGKRHRDITKTILAKDSTNLVKFTLNNLPVSVVHSRITSKLLPLATLKSFDQEKMNYELVLKEAKVRSLCQEIKKFIAEKKITVSLHSSQFVSLAAAEEIIRTNSQAELIYHAKVLELISEKAIIITHLNSKREFVTSLGEEKYIH